MFRIFIYNHEYCACNVNEISFYLDFNFFFLFVVFYENFLHYHLQYICHIFSVQEYDLIINVDKYLSGVFRVSPVFYVLK